MQQAAYKLAEEVYKNASASEGTPEGAPGEQPSEPKEEKPKKHTGKDGVEDADYEVVD